jgi:exopolyphosphatase/guanosine-5'-triphosphate,3'-diphosphate pyrophosphatase
LKIAGIDIGTNTILMLIAEYHNSELRVIEDYHEIVRLGEGVDKSGYINDQAIERAVKVFEKYAFELNKHGICNVKAVATSAMRDAKNREVVADIIEYHLGRKIEIISGAEEARYSFLGTVTKPFKSLVIDIGGGSTELITGESGLITSRESLQIGAVRITEKFLKDSPPTSDQIRAAVKYIDEMLDKTNLKAFSGDIYAVGGTATTIATTALNLDDFDDHIVHGSILLPETLSDITEKYLTADAMTIQNLYKVHPKRADLIGAGAMILDRISKIVEKPIIISSHGLRYGLVKSFL